MTLIGPLPVPPHVLGRLIREHLELAARAQAEQVKK